MTLDKIHTKLLGNLYKPFIFYFPSSLIPQEKMQSLDSPALNDVLDKIMYINKKGMDYTVLTTESLYLLLEKSAILDTNMFLLLKQKKVLSSSELSFLTEKYHKTLTFYARVSNWMHLNVASLNTELSLEVAIYFETQSIAFENHLKAFEKYFLSKEGTLPEPINWLTSIKNDFPPLKQLAASETEIISSFVEDKNPAKKKKLPLISDVRAQHYLLETVFNVRF